MVHSCGEKVCAGERFQSERLTLSPSEWLPTVLKPLQFLPHLSLSPQGEPSWYVKRDAMAPGFSFPRYFPFCCQHSSWIHCWHSNLPLAPWFSQNKRPSRSMSLCNLYRIATIILLLQHHCSKSPVYLSLVSTCFQACSLPMKQVVPWDSCTSWSLCPEYTSSRCWPGPW